MPYGKMQFGFLNFGRLSQKLRISWPLTSSEVSVSADIFRDLLKCALACVKFDERYYLLSYPDVVDALKDGLFTDAHHHYLEFGYFEDRLPFQVEVDEAFYFWAYPDIKAEVLAGTMPSAQVHFELCGYKEGRAPREGWTLIGG